MTLAQTHESWPLAVALAKWGYKPFSSPGERHGSKEWPFFKVSEGLTRFVTFAVTPAEGGAGLEVEIWIGAEADQRFTRQRVASMRMSPQQAATLEKRLAESIELAVEAADSLGLSDLTEPYAFRAQAVAARQL